MSITTSENVRAVKIVLTAALQHTQADSTDAAFAMAQMLGEVAALVDKHEGFLPFEKRWEMITEVAREHYERTRLGHHQQLIGRL